MGSPRRSRPATRRLPSDVLSEELDRFTRDRVYEGRGARDRGYRADAVSASRPRRAAAPFDRDDLRAGRSGPPSSAVTRRPPPRRCSSARSPRARVRRRLRHRARLLRRACAARNRRSRARATRAARGRSRSARRRVHETRRVERASTPTRGAARRSRTRPRARAHQRRPSAGADATPQTIAPSRSSASSVAHTGMPREKFRVPSIGSTIQRIGPPSSPSSSPSTPSPGRSRAMRSRSIRSTARSASVTGVRSAFVSTCRSPARKRGSVSASAASASSRA